MLCCVLWLFLLSVAVKWSGGHHMLPSGQHFRGSLAEPSLPALSGSVPQPSLSAPPGGATQPSLQPQPITWETGAEVPSSSAAALSASPSAVPDQRLDTDGASAFPGIPALHWPSLPGLPSWPLFGFGSDRSTEEEEDSFACKVTELREVQLWPGPRRTFCCNHHNVGCYYERCHTTEAVVSWTPKQREVCCEVEGIGCIEEITETSTTTKSIRPLPFDCILDSGGVDSWPPAKREFCCEYSLRGCPTRTETTTTTWPTTLLVTTTTARPTIMVPFPACNVGDIGCTTIYPTPLPLPSTTRGGGLYAVPAASAEAVAAAQAAAAAQLAAGYGQGTQPQGGAGAFGAGVYGAGQAGA